MHLPEQMGEGGEAGGGAVPAIVKTWVLWCCALQPEVRLDLDQQNGPARVWAAQEPIQREIRHLFRRFLRDFASPDSGELVYRQRMRDMCTSARAAPPTAVSASPRCLCADDCRRALCLC